MASLMPGETYGMPNSMGGVGGLLSNPALQIGLGILANNNSRNLGQVLGRGALQGLGNIQQQQAFQMQQNLLNMQLERARQEQARAQQREEALPRLLQGQSAYTTEQETPVQSFQNMPMPAQEGAQAPNFGTTKQSITTMQKKPVFNQDAYTKDLVSAGYADDLIKQQFAPKKIGYRDIGDRLIPYDETTGAPRTDLEPIPKGLSPDSQANLIMRNFEFNNLSAAQKANNDLTLRGQGITLRGQNLTDARAKEANNLKKSEVNGNINWKYDAGSDEFVAPPTAEFPMGRRSGSVAKQNAAQSMDYIINQFRGDSVAGKTGVLDKTMQGGVLGASGIAGSVLDYQDQKRFNNLKEQMSTELRTLFRIPGEGALSDKEQAQYGIQLPDVKYSRETNEQILDDVKNRIRLRTQTPNPLQQRIIPSGAAGGTINSAFGAGGWSAREKK